MGFSVSWVAVKGETLRGLSEALGLRGTGAFEEFPESPRVGIELDSGWALVFANEYGYALSLPLDRLSARHELVACAVEEHVMHSRAVGWRHGREDWSVTHDAERGIEHLETTGYVPPAFAAIRDRLFAEQRTRGDADYAFDVPVEVARTLTGFRYDQDVAEADEMRFEVLDGAAAAPWWKFWR